MASYWLFARGAPSSEQGIPRTLFTNRSGAFHRSTARIAQPFDRLVLGQPFHSAVPAQVEVAPVPVVLCVRRIVLAVVISGHEDMPVVVRLIAGRGSRGITALGRASSTPSKSISFNTRAAFREHAEVDALQGERWRRARNGCRIGLLFVVQSRGCQPQLLARASETKSLPFLPGSGLDLTACFSSPARPGFSAFDWPVCGSSAE